MYLLNSCTLTPWLLLRALSNKVYILSQRRLHILSNDTLCSLYEVVYPMIQFHSFFLHFGLTFWQYFLAVLMITFKNGVRHELGWSNSGGGGEVSRRKFVAQSACQYDVTCASVTQNGEQSVHRGDGLTFRFCHGNTVPISWIWRFYSFYCHRKLDLSTFLKWNVQWCNEF